MTAHVLQCGAVCATPCLSLRCRSLPGDYYLTRSIYGDFAIQVRQYECQPNMACFSGARILYGDTVINFGYQNLYVPAAKVVVAQRRITWLRTAHTALMLHWLPNACVHAEHSHSCSLWHVTAAQSAPVVCGCTLQ